MPKAMKLTLLALSTLLAAFVFVGGFMPGYLPGSVRASSDDPNAYRQMEVYSEVLQHIQNDYVVTPSIDKVTAGALHGLLEGLDPESSYMTAKEYQQYLALQHAGAAQVGLDISKKYGYATVVSVEPDSAAEKANIKDDDVIEAIDGKSTRVLSAAMIRALLNGQPGSTVNLSVIRPASSVPDTVTLTRQILPYPPVEATSMDNGAVLYLRPYRITKNRVHAVIEHLHAMQKNKQQKVLLDLRDVAEGDNDSALRLANAFVQSGTLAQLVGQTVPKQTLAADPKKFVTAAPLAVLVNHGTSGPAELLAAALLDNKRADVIGEPTFGSGVMLRQFPLQDGGIISLAVAKYESPSGIVIQEKGVQPSVEAGTTAVADADAMLKTGAPSAKPASSVPLEDSDWQVHTALQQLQKKPTGSQ